MDFYFLTSFISLARHINCCSIFLVLVCIYFFLVSTILENIFNGLLAVIRIMKLGFLGTQAQVRGRVHCQKDYGEGHLLLVQTVLWKKEPLELQMTCKYLIIYFFRQIEFINLYPCTTNLLVADMKLVFSLQTWRSFHFVKPESWIVFHCKYAFTRPKQPSRIYSFIVVCTLRY